MNEIERIGGETPTNFNQIVRWVTTKEEHASKIQDQIAAYWLAQRVKRPNLEEQDEAGRDARRRYSVQLVSVHEMTVAAMKCKQTTDVGNVAAFRRSLRVVPHRVLRAGGSRAPRAPRRGRGQGGGRRPREPGLRGAAQEGRGRAASAQERDRRLASRQRWAGPCVALGPRGPGREWREVPGAVHPAEGTPGATSTSTSLRSRSAESSNSTRSAPTGKLGGSGEDAEIRFAR